jgi:hypothetical protein
MKDLYGYLGIFENIIYNEITDTAFSQKLTPGSNALESSIEEIVNSEKSGFKSLENQTIEKVIEKFKSVSIINSLQKINSLFIKYEIKNFTKDELQKIIENLIEKYSSIKDSGKTGQTLSIPNASLEIKSIIQEKHNNTSDDFNLFFKKVSADKLFHEASQKISFAVTLQIRLNQIFKEKNNFSKYLNDMFKPNEKIALTAKRLGSSHNENIKNYVNFINRDNSDFDSSKYNYPKKAKVLQFTLPAFQSKIGEKVCKGAGSCAAFCYAAAGTYQYPLGVFKSEFSLMFSLSNKFADEVKKYLSKIANNKSVFYFVRIHDSGDFYSKIYLEKWLEIAKEFPNIFFYGYTKQLGFVNIKNVPANFKLIQSKGSRNDKFLEKLIFIKSKYFLNSEDKLSEESKKEIIDLLEISEENYSEENLKAIMKKLTFSMVFKNEEEFENYKKQIESEGRKIDWILVEDDDIAALDVGLKSDSPIGIALIVHGANKGKLKTGN